MSLYYEAAAILANADNIGGSLKSRLYTRKDLKSTPGQLFALIAETAKWSAVLKDVVEKCGLLAAEKKLTPVLAILLTHDLLLAKGGVAAPATHVLKLAISRHKARLTAEFTKARIRYGHATVDSFKDAVGNGDFDQVKEDAQKQRHPRWVRVNVLTTTLQEQLQTTFAAFKKAEDLAEVLTASKRSRIYFIDPNIPNLLALPSRIDLSKSPAYADGHIIFQDKASCFPAYLLDPKPGDGDVIDGTAAPGNKTTHLAAILSSRSQGSQEQKVVAFERDKGRTVSLHKMVKLASADSIVQVKGGSDFLSTKPDSVEFTNVGAILLDPSCSGTGIVGRDDGLQMHLPQAPKGQTTAQQQGKGKKRKRDGDAAHIENSTVVLSVDMDDSAPEETPINEKLSERLAALSSFQLHILTHAMRFSNVRKITYSTCSIHFEENEGVVFQALASATANERGWAILKKQNQPKGLSNWHRRGAWEEDKISSHVDEATKLEVLDACIRCDKGTEDGTMGFFVAAFVRETGHDRNETVANHLDEEEEEEEEEEEVEWNGFGSDDGLQAEHPTSNSDQKPEKKRKKRKKNSEAE